MALLHLLHQGPQLYVLSMVLLSVLVLAKYVYRLWLHPLRNIPGPLLGRASSIWATWYARKLRKAQAIEEAHQRYGPVVRIGPNELSFSNPSALKTIYGHGSRLPKSEFYQGGKFTHLDNVFSMRNIQAHSARRAVMAPVFAQRFVSNYIPTIREKMSQAFTTMIREGNGGSETVDVYQWVHALALDVVFHFTLNHESGILETGKPHQIIRDLEDFQSVFAWTAIFPFLRSVGRFVPIGAISKPFKSLHGWIEFCLDVVGRERQQDRKASFISRLLENKDEFIGRQLSDIEVAEELISIMFAGSGTAANTISFLLWAVVRQGTVYERLVQELQDNLPIGEVPAYEAVQNLPYLNAVIMEALRLYPTIPGTQPRKVDRAPVEIEGYAVPPGTVVGCQNYSIHRFAPVFTNPESFNPDRWLKEDATSLKAAFNGFGSGPRACIGRNLAMIELQMFVSSFLLKFDPKFSEDFKDDLMEMTDGFSGGPCGQTLPMYLRERS